MMNIKLLLSMIFDGSRQRVLEAGIVRFANVHEDDSSIPPVLVVMGLIICTTRTFP
jgi:hypothetical protein